MTKFIGLFVAFASLNGFAANDYSYIETVGANAKKEACVADLVGQVIRDTKHQRDLRITSVTTHALARLHGQYNLTAEDRQGRQLEGWALVTFEKKDNSLLCWFASRNFLNAGTHRLCLTTEHSALGIYKPKYFVLQLSEAGFLFEAGPRR